MKFRDKLVYLWVMLGLIMFCPTKGHAVDLTNPLFHSGITLSGHSGLLITKAGTSVAPGKLYVGGAPSYFDRDLAGGRSENKLTIPLLVTYGLPKNFELAGRIPFVSRGNGTSDSGIAELDASLKWSFLQQEGKSYPSIAAGLTGKLSFSNRDEGLTEMDDYALEFFLSGTALIDLGPYRDYAFSLYGEGRAVFNDPGKATDEKHGAYSMGILLPLSSSTDMGFLLEFDGTLNRGITSEDDFIRLTPAFRFNSQKWAFTLGISLVNPEPSGEDTYLDYTLSAIYGF